MPRSIGKKHQDSGRHSQPIPGARQRNHSLQVCSMRRPFAAGAKLKALQGLIDGVGPNQMDVEPSSGNVCFSLESPMAHSQCQFWTLNSLDEL